jgi:hypothetical protein
MEQNQYWKADSRFAGQEFLSFVWNWNFPLTKTPVRKEPQ